MHKLKFYDVVLELEFDIDGRMEKDEPEGTAPPVQVTVIADPGPFNEGPLIEPILMSVEMSLTLARKLAERSQ